MCTKRAKTRQSIFVGDVFETQKSGKCRVIEYNNSLDCTVQFEDGTRVKCLPHSAKHGTVKNPMQARVCGVGFMGVGSENSKIDGKAQKAYTVWCSMLNRCYGKPALRNKSYADVEVCTEWHNFQNFSLWYKKQKGFEQPGWQLDKDIMCKGNSLYSPDTARLIPAEINSFSILRKADRGECMIGVVKHSGKFYAQLSSKGCQKCLGSFNSESTAFECYKAAKESEAKRLAEKYKDVIDTEIYESLLNFVVDRND